MSQWVCYHWLTGIKDYIRRSLLVHWASDLGLSMHLVFRRNRTVDFSFTSAFGCRMVISRVAQPSPVISAHSYENCNASHTRVLSTFHPIRTQSP
jgi:hypothetical protein